MAQEIRRLGLTPDVVLVSSARRTLQTLAALEPWPNNPPTVEPTDSLYLASASDLLDAVNAVEPDARCVLVVAHNPGLHDLALGLAGAHAAASDPQVQRLAAGYPSGALAEFAVPTAWRDLRESGAQLTRFLAPNDLSQVSA